MANETVKEPTDTPCAPCDGSCGCPEVALLRQKNSELHRAKQKAEGALLSLQQKARPVDPWASESRKAEAVDRDEIGETIDRTEILGTSAIPPSTDTPNNGEGE